MTDMDTSPQHLASQSRGGDSFSELNRRAGRYRTECGCAMGGAFLVAALVGWIAHVIEEGHFDAGHLVRQMLVGALIVITCSIAGKGIGIGIARLRYVVICRRIHRLYRMEVSPCPRVPAG